MGSALIKNMKTKSILSLIDMDIGIFITYEMTAEFLTTKLFRTFTLNSIPLKRVMDLREAKAEDITPLNRLNWFNFIKSRRTLCPVYTLQATETSPRIFMRLDRGSHFLLKSALGKLNA